MGTADTVKMARCYIDQFITEPERQAPTLEDTIREFNHIMPVDWTDKGVSRTALMELFIKTYRGGDR